MYSHISHIVCVLNCIFTHTHTNAHTHTLTCSKHIGQVVSPVELLADILPEPPPEPADLLRIQTGQHAILLCVCVCVCVCGKRVKKEGGEEGGNGGEMEVDISIIYGMVWCGTDACMLACTRSGLCYEPLRVQ